MSEMISPATGVAWAVLGVVYAAVFVWLLVRIVNRRQRSAKWTAVGLIVLAALYVLSSGPMTTLGRWSHTTYTPAPALGSNAVMVTTQEGPGVWWSQVYAPLLWASDQSWGDQLYSYWELFSGQEVAQPP
jgi:hypothetical protein